MHSLRPRPFLAASAASQETPRTTVAPAASEALYSPRSERLASSSSHLEMVRATQAPAGGHQRVCFFNTTKKETHTGNGGFKQLARRLKSAFKCQHNKDEISLDRLKEADMVVFGNPRDLFSVTELDAVKSYIHDGGCVLLCLGEGGESKRKDGITNTNYLTDEFGITVNEDVVVRTVHSKYLHPKQVLVTDGILNREVANVVGWANGGPASGEDALRETTNKSYGASGKVDPLAHGAAGGASESVSFVYPHGATLNVQKPAVPLLSSGKIAYPMHRPLMALWHQPGKGHLIVCGSVSMFEDQFVDKEGNPKIIDFLVKWSAPDSSVRLNQLDAEEPEIGEDQHLPDTESLAERVRCCLQTEDELPRDFTTLFRDNLFKFDTNLVPEAVAMYSKLGVRHQPLTLIAPQFETPLPPLQPAVFAPALREPPPPALDLFDLDEQFASEGARLAHLTNKCSEGTQEDVRFFLQEGAQILNLPNDQVVDKKTSKVDPKRVLSHMLHELVRFKNADMYA